MSKNVSELQLERYGLHAPVGVKSEIERIKRQSENVAYTYKRKIVFSAVSPEDKYTEDLVRCVGLILAGRRADGQTTSMLGHISPAMIDSGRSLFDELMAEKLAAFQEQTLPETRMGGLVGGLWGDLMRDGLWDWAVYYNLEQYQMLKGIKEKVRNTLGINVPRLYHPKGREETSDVYLSTQQNRIILVEQ